MQRLIEGAEVLEEYGVDAGDFGQLGDLDVMAGFAQLVTACAYAEILLVDWEGVVDDAGAPVEISPAAVRAALIYGAAERGPLLLSPFLRWINGPRRVAARWRPATLPGLPRR